MKIKKNLLISSKDAERFEDILDNSPITNPNKFYAAKIMVDSIEFQKLFNKEYSLSKKIFLSGILGIILGILFVLLSRIINKKKL